MRWCWIGTAGSGECAQKVRGACRQNEHMRQNSPAAAARRRNILHNLGMRYAHAVDSYVQRSALRYKASKLVLSHAPNPASSALRQDVEPPNTKACIQSLLLHNTTHDAVGNLFHLQKEASTVHIRSLQTRMETVLAPSSSSAASGTREDTTILVGCAHPGPHKMGYSRTTFSVGPTQQTTASWQHSRRTS